MRVIQEIRVHCENKQELERLVEWIEEQDVCTVEFNVVQRQVDGAPIVVSITPWLHEDATSDANFDEFCKELKHAVSLNG